MKITIKNKKIKHSVSMPDDTQFDEFMDLFKALCKANFNEEMVDKYWE